MRVTWAETFDGPMADNENPMDIRLEGEVIGVRSGFLGIGTYLVVNVPGMRIYTVREDEVMEVNHGMEAKQ